MGRALLTEHRADQGSSASVEAFDMADRVSASRGRPPLYEVDGGASGTVGVRVVGGSAARSSTEIRAVPYSLHAGRACGVVFGQERSSRL